jgi:hypothetical protein
MMFETTIAGSLPKPAYKAPLGSAPQWRANGSTGPGRRVQRLIHLKGVITGAVKTTSSASFSD